MKALFVHDTFYSRGPDGAVYSFGAFPSALWQERFLPHFSSLTVIGREKPFDPSHARMAIRSDTPGVSFRLLDNINRPMARLLEAKPIINAIRDELTHANVIIIRGPSEFGLIAAKESKRAVIKINAEQARETLIKRPIVCEVTGCAFDNLWHHSQGFKSLTSKLYAPVKTFRVRQMVNNADHVTYVTKSFLQKRYPTRGTIANASNVNIETPSSDALQKRISKIEKQTSIIFGMIGNYENNLKGLPTALLALSSIRDVLPNFEFRVLGHGSPALYAEYDFVKFYEPVNDPAAVVNFLDEINIYLQPSMHEGLPRALIEAMSRACPALGSNAGGIPELLDPASIHKRGNVAQLAKQILNLTKPALQKKQAQRNFETAKEYSRDILVPIRKKFWSDVAENTRSKLGNQT